MGRGKRELGDWSCSQIVCMGIAAPGLHFLFDLDLRFLFQEGVDTFFGAVSWGDVFILCS